MSRKQPIETLLPIEYFELQLEYAKQISRKLHLDLFEILRQNTSYWRLIGNKGYEFNGEFFAAGSPLWINFINTCNSNSNILESAYELYKQNHFAQNSEKKYFGCFRYDYYAVSPVIDKYPFCEDRDVVRIHFRNNEVSGIRPLSSSRRDIRRDELRKMFIDIHEKFPNVKFVHGGTWLYNISAYSCLFPSSYTSSLFEEKPFPRTQGIWGQFLTSSGTLHDHRTREFRENFYKSESGENFLYAFPFQIKLARGRISDFYREYRILL
jgi:hypothetical protein